ncbi:MAG: hypothetical protein WD468_04375 [Pirellulales bacterium]
MSYDGTDDEDWYDEDDAFDDEESVPCPECGGLIPGISGKCPACGHWLTDLERDAASFGATKRRWLIVTAWVVLAVFLLPLIAFVFSMFRGNPSVVR